jgi:radical SAM superfamily enzyme YgiQ (UPF0313 family)
MKDLDSLPMPAWDLVNIEMYRQSWLKHTGYFSMNIGTTRGCPFKCNWCAKPIYGNRYNARSPENVVKELLFLGRTYKFDHIWFCDDIFGLKPGWVSAFASLWKGKSLNSDSKFNHGLIYSFRKIIFTISHAPVVKMRGWAQKVGRKKTSRCYG